MYMYICVPVVIQLDIVFDKLHRNQLILTAKYSVYWSYVCLSLSLSLTYTGAGTFGAVRAGIYRPRAGGPEVKCAVKCLKQSAEDPVPKV